MKMTNKKINKEKLVELKSVEKKTNKFYYFIKGIIMGIFDLVPGISGGTIALISGIYEKLIKEINNFFKFLSQLFAFNKKRIKITFKETDFIFLILLTLGVVIGIIISVFAMSYLLENYFVQTMGIITGIILMSGILLAKKIYKHKKQIIFGIIGLVLGIVLSILTPGAGHVFSYVQVFFLGSITITAMMLPGISGALILLLLGGYEFMLNSLKNITTEYLIVFTFIFGALLGLLAFSKVITYFLEKHKEKTMMFLALLVIGATTKPVLEIQRTNEAGTGIIFFGLSLIITYFFLRKKQY